jgi:two-component sensor histidine kinase
MVAQQKELPATKTQKGKSLYFDGKDDQIRAPYSPILNISSGTLEATIKIIDSTYYEWHTIISKQFAYQITLYGYQLATFDWKERRVYAYGPSLNDNKWHHVALVFQDSVINGSQLYLDGQAIGLPFTYHIFNQTGQIDIGGNNFWDQFFNGIIDEVRIWSKPLSKEEIQKNATTEISRYNNNLLLYYKFNQGIANGNNTSIVQVKDETTNKLDAYFFNFSLNGTTSNFTQHTTLEPCNNNAVISFMVDNKWLITYTVVLIILLFFFYRFRLRFLAKQNKQLEKKVILRTEQLSKMLSEKDALIQEVHHRVKNNLQFISSIIDMQLMMDKEKDNAALDDVARRITAIALVHELLYRQSDIEKINSTDYFNAFINSIYQLIGSKNIHFSHHIAEMTFTVKQCTSVGMIMSELIANSLKYAFEQQPTPAIQIALTVDDASKEVTLTYADNGKGFNENNYPKGLGTKLIAVFCKQINANYYYNNNDGVLFTLKFTI